jgi:hypothetical protein
MEAGSLTIAKVDQGRRDVRTLLAVAEAQQFSLGQDWPAGPLLTQVPPCSIGRPTVSTSRSDSSRSAYAESGTAPVASNTELKKQRGAAASTTSRMSTPEGPRSRSGFSSASLMSAGEAATLRANSPWLHAADLSTRHSRFRVLGWTLGTISVASGPQRRRICPQRALLGDLPRPGLASHSLSTSIHLDDRGMHGEGSACGIGQSEKRARPRGLPQPASPSSSPVGSPPDMRPALVIPNSYR